MSGVIPALIGWSGFTVLAIGVKVDSGAYALVKKTGAFALNMLSKGQQDATFGFFKPFENDGNTISGEAYHAGANGAPILVSASARIALRADRFAAYFSVMRMRFKLRCIEDVFAMIGFR